MTKKIIFDTDPGIDDAMALFFAQCSPMIELMGITTVAGNASLAVTTRNALYLKERWCLDASVYRGSDTPLLLESNAAPTHIHGLNGLGNIQVPEPCIDVENTSAAQFIVDTIMSNPGEITLVAVGRLSNLAIALSLNPDIVNNIHQVVIMGGALGLNAFSGNVSPCAEANIAGDPHAADRVFRANWPLTMVGLDVTMKTIMTDEFMLRIKKQVKKEGEFLYKISRVYDEFHREHVKMDGFAVHDSSAIAYVIDPTLFTIKTGAIRAVTEGIAIGQTIFSPNDKKFPASAWDNIPHKQVCIDVNSKGVLDLYEKTVTTF